MFLVKSSKKLFPYFLVNSAIQNVPAARMTADTTSSFYKINYKDWSSDLSRECFYSNKTSVRSLEGGQDRNMMNLIIMIHASC